MNKSNHHNYGIDLLRLLAFAYVIVLHTLGHGGIIGAAAYGSNQYKLSAAMEIWAYCSVNLFGLISGYVSCGENPGKTWRQRALSYLRLWLQVVFFAVVPSAVLHFAMPGTIAGSDILKAFFPVTTGQYWYFSAYTGLFLLMPVLNAALGSLDGPHMKRYLIIFLAAFSLYASPMERFALREGYSTFWLVLLYLAGGAVRKLQDRETNTAPPSGRTGLMCAGGIALCALISWIWLTRDAHLTILETEIKRTTWMSYTSFTVTLSALLHLVWFSRIKVPVKLQKPLRMAAACSFGIYLLNTQPAIWKLTDGRLASLGSGPLIRIVLAVAANVLIFMAAGIAVMALCVSVGTFLIDTFSGLFKRAE